MCVSFFFYFVLAVFCTCIIGNKTWSEFQYRDAETVLYCERPWCDISRSKFNLFHGFPRNPVYPPVYTSVQTACFPSTVSSSSMHQFSMGSTLPWFFHVSSSLKINLFFIQPRAFIHLRLYGQAMQQGVGPRVFIEYPLFLLINGIRNYN